MQKSISSFSRKSFVGICFGGFLFWFGFCWVGFLFFVLFCLFWGFLSVFVLAAAGPYGVREKEAKTFLEPK